MPELLVGVVVIGVVLWLLARIVNQSTPVAAVNRRDQEELLGLRVLVDDLKDTAWDHRELDSALATIILDKIRTFERRDRPA
jgi:hypothetical protein